MIKSILVPLSDSMTSHSVLNYIARMPLDSRETRFTLLHVYKEPSVSQDLMGKSFVKEQESRMKAFLENARERLIDAGYNEDNIDIVLAKDSYPTVTDGIISQFNSGDYDMVIIGRKQMTKAEEFVMGDISIKLIRSLENTAILVVKFNTLG